MIQKYTLDSQEVEAIEVINDQEPFYELTVTVAAWTGTCEPTMNRDSGDINGLFVGDMEGPIQAVFGDFVVRDQHGTVSVFKPEVFHRFFKKL